MKNIWQVDYTTYFYIFLSILSGDFKTIIILYLIIIFHELGHVYWLKKFKYSILKITIYPFGGITNYYSLVNHNIKEHILISLGGIINQIILIPIFYLLFKYNLINNYSYHLFNTYNAALIIFNLLPIIPLDGSKVYNLFLEYFLSYYLANKITIIASFITLFIFIFKILSLKINNLIIICFLIYQIILFIKNQKYLNNKFLTERYLYDLPFHKIKYFTNYNPKLLYQDTYHYFNYISEKTILNKLYK
jgi:stage IV sporulation protein FB